MSLLPVLDIEGLHPLGRLGEIQHFLQQLQRIGCFFLGGGGPLHLLLRVADGHIRQRGLFAPLGYMDPDPVSGPLRQRLGQLLTVTSVHAE